MRAAWFSPKASRRARWWTVSRSGSTAPARSFVPPRSTPITQRAGTRPRYPVRHGRREAKLHPLPLAPEAVRQALRRPARRARRPAGRPSASGPGRKAQARRPLHVLARARLRRPGRGRLGADLAAAVPDLGPGPAPEGQRRGRLDPQRLGLPAHLAEHDPRARLRRPHQGHEGARRERRRPQPLGHDPADARRRRASPRGSRSRATRSPTSPATAPTRSTPPTRYGGPGARGQDGRGIPRHRRSTTSSRSTSRTSPTSSTRSAASTTRAAA